MKWIMSRARSEFKYGYLFIIAIAIAKVLADYLRSNGDPPSATITGTFAASFIEWFGVLYGILLPLILVRVWEQLDDIDREFDREADTIRILYEDLSFLRGKNKTTGREIAGLLREYVRHVIKKFPYEVKESHKKKSTRIRFLNKIGNQSGDQINPIQEDTFQRVRKAGDDILIKIRKRFTELIHPNVMEAKDAEFLIPELFARLNEIVDIRGDRIGFASQRLFDTMRSVALIASIIFLIPFYIVGFSDQTSILDDILILGITLLVIFMYMIIEDFDEPFGGTWKIDDESWYSVRQEIVCAERQLRLDERANKVILVSEPRKHLHHRSESLRRSKELKSVTWLAARQIKLVQATTDNQRKEKKQLSINNRAIKVSTLESSTKKPMRRKKSQST